MFAIKVENLSKIYKKQLVNSSSGMFSFRTKTEDFYALKELNFEILKGETVGIIGGNGAGKSTLLKILSNITYPSAGRALIDGRVTSLLEVGTGFHPELSGRENVYLNGSLLGMSKKEIQAKFDEIVNFSGIERFIDSPVKNYSSGMYVRLAFSVAAHLQTEIILLDEILAVGDAQFQKKCLQKIEDMKKNGKSILFVSHNLSSLRQLCDRSILLDKGNQTFQGKTDQVINKYLSLISHKKDYTFQGILKDKFLLKNIKINNKDISDCIHFMPDESLEIALEFSHAMIHSFRITLSLFFNGIRVFSLHDLPASKSESEKFLSIFCIPKEYLRPGQWIIGVGGHNKDMSEWFWNEQVDTIEIAEIYSDTFEKINLGIINLNCVTKRVSI